MSMSQTIENRSRRDRALDGLKPLEMSDYADYKAGVDAGKQIGWGYFFPYMMARKRPGRVNFYMGRDAGSVCIFIEKLRGDGARLELFHAPAPMDAGVLHRCLERANDYNGDYSARVMRIDEKDIGRAKDVANLRITPRIDQFLYDPAAFADLRGKRYYTLRRHVAQVEALPDVRVEPFSVQHTADCLALLDRWKARYKAQTGKPGGAASSARILKDFTDFPAGMLIGQVVFVDGRLVAYSLGGELSPRIACSFEFKSDHDIPGLSYFARRSFMSSLSDFRIINDGSDARNAGLRQQKMSLRPVGMHQDYRIFQRRPK